MQIRRAEAADEKALARIRRSAILTLAVPTMSALRLTAMVICASSARHADTGRKVRGHIRQLQALGLDVTVTPCQEAA